MFDHVLDLPHKPTPSDNDAFPCFDIIGGRNVYVQAKSVKEYAIRELLERVTSLNEQAIARIRLLESTSVSSTEALASSVKTLESQMLAADGSPLLARVEFAMETQAKASGYLAGKIALRATAGNVVTGMTILSATGAGEDISEVRFDAANFKIFNGTSSVPVFQAVGGQVRVQDLVLVPSDVDGLGSLATQNSVTYASITGTKPDSDADNTYDELIGGININSGGVTLSGVASIKSSNYSSGSAGWAIKADGSVEFNNAKFRGVIDMSVSNASGGVSIQAGSGTSFPTVELLTSGVRKTAILATSLGGNVTVYDSSGNQAAYMSGSTGNIYASGSFIGDGSQLTDISVSASDISSGTLSNSRLPSSISVSSLTASGTVTGGGFACREGVGGSTSGNRFNIAPGSGGWHLWIDVTDLGVIQLA